MSPFERRLRDIPRSDDTAWVIKCDYNRRYFWTLPPFEGGAITVARIHAERFPSRVDAYRVLSAINARQPATSSVVWRVVKLRTAPPSGDTRKEKPHG